MKLHTSALVLAMSGIMLSQTAFSNDSANLSNSEFQHLKNIAHRSLIPASFARSIISLNLKKMFGIIWRLW